MKSKIILLFLAIGIGGLGLGLVLADYWKKRWYTINAPFGKKLGYPDCCIQAFCDQPPEILKVTGCNSEDKMRYLAGCIEGEFTGFVPCASHARQITDGEITLDSLIKNRDPELPPFPNV